MRRIVRITALAVAFAATGPGAFAAVSVGQPAPNFSAVDTSGKPVSLADFKGRTVVLEWVNPGCPFVQKHYDSANMPATQKRATAQGVVWLAINSTNTGASDYLAPAALAGWIKGKGGAPTATLMDADGRVGRAYGARATPHMYVIDPAGKLVYAGAIDSKPSTNPADIKTATNYVNQAVGETLAGKPVSVATTQAYGCSVKYSD
jgi:thiol-disulfide isomerase/thioredoxin